MDLAGLRVVMDADFSAVYAAFNQANAMMQDFSNNVKNAFNSIPDFKNKFNFTSNGASQAAQDAREYARAARDQAAADLDATKAKKILEDQQRRNEQATKKEKDAYGQLVADSNALVRAYYNAAAAIIKDGDAAGITAAKLEEMRQAALAGQEQLKGIEAGVGRFQRNVGNYASAVSGYFGQTFSRTIHAGTEALFGMQRGVNALAIDLPNLIQEFQSMVAQQKAIKASGGEALSTFQLIQAAFNPMTIAIQLGIMGLVRYGPELVEFGKELFGVSKSFNEATSKASIFSDAIKNSDYSTAIESVASLTEKIKLAKEGFISKKAVVDEYNNTIGESIGRINNLQQAETQLIQKAPAYIQMMLQKAAAAAALNKAAENAAEAARVENTKDLGFGSTINALRNNMSTLSKLQMAFNVSGTQSASVLVDAAEAVNKGVKEKTKELNDTSNSWIKIYNDFLEKAANTAKGAGINLDPIKFNSTSTKDAKSALQELIQANNEAVAELQSGSINMGQSLEKEIGNYQSYIKALLLKGVNINSPEIQDSFAAIDTLNAKLAQPIDTSNALLVVKQQYQDLADAAYQSAEKIGTATEMTSGFFKRMNDSIDLGTIRDKLGQQIDEINAMIQKMAQDAVIGVSEIIGTALADKSQVPNLFKGLLSQFGSQVEQLGEILIAKAIQFQALKDEFFALFSAQPALAAIAGVGIVAIGAYLKGLAQKDTNKGIKGYADGGVAYGPTLGLFGEYAGARHDPEVVAPLSKLSSILRQQNFGNGGAQVFIPDMRISGQDLLVIFKRANKSFDR